MKKFMQNGYMISVADAYAVANDLDESLEAWALKGPKYMVSKKPIKQLMKFELQTLRSKKVKEGKSLPANEPAIINEICSMPEFKSKKYQSGDLKKPNRKQAATTKILSSGIEIEDHEHQAANNYWENPETLLTDLLDNKIAMCKKRFVEEWTKKLINDPTVETIPASDDDLIMLVVQRPDYKNRIQRDAESHLFGN